MSFFITEMRVEDLLEFETRILTGPDGVKASFTAFKAFWKAYDFLILFGIQTHERIMQISLQNVEDTEAEGESITFGESFGAVVWNANGHARRILGIDCFAVRAGQ